jgi:hypothetical protein
MKYFYPSTSLLSESKFYSFFSFDSICNAGGNVDGSLKRNNTRTFYENPHEYALHHQEARDEKETLSKQHRRHRSRRHSRKECSTRIETVLSVSDLLKDTGKQYPPDSPTASLSSIGTASTCSSSSLSIVDLATLPESILRNGNGTKAKRGIHYNQRNVRFAHDCKAPAPTAMYEKETKRERRRRLRNSGSNTCSKQKLILTSSYLHGFAMSNDMGGSLYNTPKSPGLMFSY